MSRAPRWLAVAGLVLWAGCGTQVTVAKSERSGPGESCEAKPDCAEGLACVDLTCRAEQMPAPDGDGGGGAPPVARTKSGAGESCNRRTDCDDGLLCLERTCRTDATPVPTLGPTKGSRGESCVASNDCERGMGCIGGACRERKLLVPHVAQECHRVECVEVDDCCRDFRPEDPALCMELDESCRSGVQFDCNLYASICDCNRICEDSVCVASVACSNDLDCGGSGVLRCFAGKCAQCASDVDCTGVAACVSGLCRAGCERNEQCPIFSVCEDHQCEHVGCQSDRDCYFESGSPRSRCVDHACRTPCESDIGCPLPFHGCVEGVCVFVGCESDEECRAVLGLADQSVSDPGRAVCRLPEE